jgi:hypothetical protein
MRTKSEGEREARNMKNVLIVPPACHNWGRYEEEIKRSAGFVFVQ